MKILEKQKEAVCQIWHVLTQRVKVVRLFFVNIDRFTSTLYAMLYCYKVYSYMANR